MDKKVKSNVIKSKSSNSAIVNKPGNKNRSNKKTRSNGEIQPLVVKKRGVYVEKKEINIGISSPDTESPQKSTKLSPPPRPNKKKFLSSVLTILSKATTGTQFPDIPEEKHKQNKFKINARKRRNNFPSPKEVMGPEVNNKRPEYKSKVLKALNTDKEKVLVLQPKKDLIQTPSNYSDWSNKEQDFKLANTYNAVKNKCNKNKDEYIIGNYVNNSNETAGGILKEVLDGRKDKRVKIMDKEPMTLVSEHFEQPRKDDNNLYTFFVDLLETTFDNCNVNVNYDLDQNRPSVSSTRISLEIEESVAKKLDVNHSPERFADVSRNPSNHYYVKNDNEIHTFPKFKYNRNADLSKAAKRRKLTTQSFLNTKKSFNLPPKSKSFDHEKKKKVRKENLLTLLKKELSMGCETYEEPRNLYQALKVIAKNKLRQQKRINFDYLKTDLDRNECMFRHNIHPRKKSLIAGFKKRNDFIRSLKKFEVPNAKIKIQADAVDVTDEDSTHSLQVYNVDYEKKPGELDRIRMNRTLETSSPSLTRCNLKSNEPVVNICESCNSSMIYGKENYGY